jgi:hypothetical protein
MEPLYAPKFCSGIVCEMYLSGKLRRTASRREKNLSSKSDRPGSLTPQEWNRITDSLLNLSSIVSEKQMGVESKKKEPIAEPVKQRYS